MHWRGGGLATMSSLEPCAVRLACNAINCEEVDEHPEVSTCQCSEIVSVLPLQVSEPGITCGSLFGCCMEQHCWLHFAVAFMMLQPSPLQQQL